MTILLETARLILRPPVEGDFEAWAAHQANEVTMAEDTVQDRRGAWGNLLSVAGSWRVLGYGSFSVLDRDSGLWIGKAGPSRPFGWPAIEMGWSLMPDWHGRGLAVEAAAAAIDWLFASHDADRVIHTIRPSNVASQRVATRLGSRNLGPIALPPPYEGIPNDEWSQSREEWALNRLKLLAR